MTVSEAMRVTGIGKTTLYAEMKSGRLRSIRVGRCRRIPIAELRAWIARCLDEDDATRITF